MQEIRVAGCSSCRGGRTTFSAEALDGAAPTLRDFDALGDGFVAFFEPPSLDERIVNQYGLFSVLPDPARNWAAGSRAIPS